MRSVKATTRTQVELAEANVCYEGTKESPGRGKRVSCHIPCIPGVELGIARNIHGVRKLSDTHSGSAELMPEPLRDGGTEDAKYASTVMSEVMRGTSDQNGGGHSKAAGFRTLGELLVGDLKAETRSGVDVNGHHERKYCYEVDYSRPIVAQVGYLGPDYDVWVHDPVTSKDSPRFFQSETYEFFTRTTWWVIPMVWCPVAFGMIYIATSKEGLPRAKLPGLIVSGVALWTILEYLLHRFLFHIKTSSFWGNTLHFLLHGVHHKHPMDGSRLVFPPVFASVIMICIWFLMGCWVTNYPNKLVIYASALLGYVAYDVTHYFLHFGNAFTDTVRNMKKYHLNHHFKDQKSGFGITTATWDWVFKTLPTTKVSSDNMRTRPTYCQSEAP